MHDDYIGAGWAFPLRTNSRGGIALVRREQELEEAMRLILATYPGERPMRPEFGSRVRDWVFRGSDTDSIAGAVARGAYVDPPVGADGSRSRTSA